MLNIANNTTFLIAAGTLVINGSKTIRQTVLVIDGKGGSKPDNAHGGGKDASKLDEVLAKAKMLFG